MKRTLFLIACFLTQGNAFAGVMLSANRLIYDGNKQDAILTLKNDESRVFLIQSWLDAKGNPLLLGRKLPFILTPPLFQMAAGAENVVQLVYTGTGLPEDRESLLWLNVKAIPSTSEQEKISNNRLLLALDNRIKVFYRPSGLQGTQELAVSQLTWKRADSSHMTAKNNSPFYVVINKLMFNDKPFSISIDTNNSVIPPFGQMPFSLPDSHAGAIKVQWSAMNDFSVPSKLYSVAVN